MSSGLSNIHADVLNIPIPEKDNERNGLIEEIKRRGQNAFQRKSLQEAEALYSRAIEINKNDHTLWSNRSAARIGMGKFDDALVDAKECVNLNPTWSKGHYRVAKAYEGLKCYDKACEAYDEVLKIEPNNTAAKNELENIKSKGLDKISSTPTQPTTSIPAQKTSSEKKASDTSSKTTTSSSTSMEVDEPLIEDITTNSSEQSSSFKGYKKRSDGKTTTYFHRDLSEEEKKLLQGNAPKPLEVSNVESTSKKNVAGSAWNEKGTFEEKDCTKWAKSRIETLLKEVSISFNNAEGIDEFSVTGISELDGDATISIVRGTKRWIFSFSLYIDWEIEINFPNSEDSKTVKGKIYLSDIESDSLGKDGSTDYEIKWANRQEAGKFESSIQNLLNNDIKKLVFGKLLQFKNDYLSME